MRFLLAGRTLTVETTNPTQYRKGRNYSVGVRHNKTVCRVEILHIDEPAGTIQIRQQILQAEPNLLARYSQYGYTSNPAQAMFGEPEAVNTVELERISQDARQTWEQRLAALRGHILDEASALERSADRFSSRKLRNLQRVATAIQCGSATV